MRRTIQIKCEIIRGGKQQNEMTENKENKNQIENDMFYREASSKRFLTVTNKETNISIIINDDFFYFELKNKR